VNWPSTTEILRYFGLMADYEQFGNEDALRRGRLVTAGCHILGAGNSDQQWESRHPECHPYLDAYRRFLREHHFELLAAEQEYRSSVHRFISHPDQIGKLDGFGMTNLELKSGSMPKCCPLQTGGQVLAMGHPAIRRFGLLLKNDGSYQLFPHDDFRDIDRFAAMIQTYWTIQEFSHGKAAA
jgi:hypothetical protein